MELPVRVWTDPLGDVEVNWDGIPLISPVFAIDCETTAVDDDGSVPRFVLMSACDGIRRVVVPPEQLVHFLLAHRRDVWVGYNMAFDFWVLIEEFRRQQKPEMIELLWQKASHGQLRDAMLLDDLYALAQTGQTQHKHKSLETATETYTNLRLHKEAAQKYRVHFDQLVGQSLIDEDDRGWFDYAAADPLATLHVYAVIHQRLADLIARHELCAPGIQSAAAN